ncbi:MAG: hypothetical protein XE11_1807 [Methanomicrobiales archaeon 53_19]|nr:MAG: hypothetical protein XE11_1807 [Methanomicrobiales archaeon 53_19]
MRSAGGEQRPSPGGEWVRYTVAGLMANVSGRGEMDRDEEGCTDLKY